MLCTFERKILRRIYGPIQDKECWHPMWNVEIYNLYKNLNIVDNNKIRKVGWVGRNVRIKEEKIPKRFLMGNFIIQDQWENHKQDGGSHHRSQEYEDKGKKKTEKNKGIF
jgi:hypothetical protein